MRNDLASIIRAVEIRANAIDVRSVVVVRIAVVVRISEVRRGSETARVILKVLLKFVVRFSPAF